LNIFTDKTQQNQQPHPKPHQQQHPPLKTTHATHFITK